MRARGAQLVLTPGAAGMKGAVEKANELHEQIPGSIILQQFDNHANRAIHEKTTAEEIWKDTDGKVDIVVGGVGTGGTISGIAAGLKKHNPDIKAFAVEPDSSPILSGGNPGPHKIQGIGANFIPGNFVRDLIDGVIRVKRQRCHKNRTRTGTERRIARGHFLRVPQHGLRSILPRNPKTQEKESLQYSPTQAKDTCQPYCMPLKNILCKIIFHTYSRRNAHRDSAVVF